MFWLFQPFPVFSGLPGIPLDAGRAGRSVHAGLLAANVPRKPRVLPVSNPNRVPVNRTRSIVPSAGQPLPFLSLSRVVSELKRTRRLIAGLSSWPIYRSSHCSAVSCFLSANKLARATAAFVSFYLPSIIPETRPRDSSWRWESMTRGFVGYERHGSHPGVISTAKVRRDKEGKSHSPPGYLYP